MQVRRGSDELHGVQPNVDCEVAQMKWVLGNAHEFRALGLSAL